MANRNTDNPTRSRPAYLALLILTIAAGLASRHFAAYLPPILSKNAGDILYATMAYFVVSLLLPRARIAGVVLLSLLYCFTIEFLKLDQSPRLVAFRYTTIGGLILGHVFTPLNFLCYIVGVAVGIFFDGILQAGKRLGQSLSSRRAGVSAP
ncbi:MAG TPA: DUF2809 domain-containing protein [Capsulimonadaceae bacterium]|nr:DUF2809 domain-containing protein [Capsulimonadaceae bacterium]